MAKSVEHPTTVAIDHRTGDSLFSRRTIGGVFVIGLLLLGFVFPATI